MSDLFSRYIWLVETIYRAGRLSYEEICDRWKHCEMGDGRTLPPRTFHNHRRAIESLFDIDIKCDKWSGNVYYIENVEDLKRNDIRFWLFEAFSVCHLGRTRSLRKKVLFEEIPYGQEYLVPIVQAMQEGKVVVFIYRSYRRNRDFEIEAEPYCVKEFRRRWYMVARSRKDCKIRIYALDRIRELAVTVEKFEMAADFVCEDYFRDSFGIIVDEGYTIETVRFRVTGDQRQYIRSLPLHRTQQEVEVGPDYSVFECRLRPTFDFQQELLSQGARIEVLTPQWLRRHIGTEIRKMARLYDTDAGRYGKSEA